MCLRGTGRAFLSSPASSAGPFPALKFRSGREKEMPPPPRRRWTAGRPVVVVQHSGSDRCASFFRTSRTRTFFATLVFLARARVRPALCYYNIPPHNCCTFRCSRRVEPPLRTLILFVIFCVHGKILLLLCVYTQNRSNGVRTHRIVFIILYAVRERIIREGKQFFSLDFGLWKHIISPQR